MRFNYFEFPNKANPQGPRILVPLIVIRLSYAGKHKDLYALIDSGADACLFHSSVAKVLGIDYKSGRQESFGGVSGHEISAFFHTVRLTVRGLSSVDLEVGFTESPGVRSGLLGQRGLFDQYQIRFERYKNTIELFPKSVGS